MSTVQFDDDGSVAKWNKKLVIVGDGQCGKTSLLMVQSGQPFPEKYIPTVFENYISRIPLKRNKIVELSLWDTAGQEEYDRLRPLSYPDTDVVIMAYDITDRNTLIHINEKWQHEMRHFLANTPKILCGTKLDLRNNDNNDVSNNKYVTYDEGSALATKLGCIKFLECSAKTGENVQDLFNLAAKLAVKGPASSKKLKNVQNCLFM